MVRRDLKHRNRHHGLFLAETLIAMALMMGVFAVVIATVHMQRRIATRMAGDRADLRQVQAGLLAMQHRAMLDASLHVHALPTTAPTGWEWTEVTLHHVTLSGLVPATTQRANP